MGALPFGLFALFVLLGVPIAFALIIAGALILVGAEGLPLLIIPQQMVAGMDSFPMLAVPLFIWAGSIMDVGGISRRLVELASSLVGHLPGGLGQVVVVSEIFFSGVSGSTSADAAAIGGIMVPQLTAKGYSREQATAIVSAACAMGILIPPAIVMVIFGVMGNVSIGKLFVACIPPALLMALGLMGQIGWQARRHNWPKAERASGATIRRAATEAMLPLFMIVVVLGGIRIGLFTPTEAAAVAVAYSLILAVGVYRALSWTRIQGQPSSNRCRFRNGAPCRGGGTAPFLGLCRNSSSSRLGCNGDGDRGWADRFPALHHHHLPPTWRGTRRRPRRRLVDTDSPSSGQTTWNRPRTLWNRHGCNPGDIRLHAARGRESLGRLLGRAGRAGSRKPSPLALLGAHVGVHIAYCNGAGDRLVLAEVDRILILLPYSDRKSSAPGPSGNPSRSQMTNNPVHTTRNATV